MREVALSQITPELAGEPVAFSATIASLRRFNTKLQESMCEGTFLNDTGSVAFVVFPRVYETTTELWRNGAKLLVEGEVWRVNDRSRELFKKGVAVRCAKVLWLNRSTFYPEEE